MGSMKIFTKRYLLGTVALTTAAGAVVLGASAAHASEGTPLVGTWSRNLPSETSSTQQVGGPVVSTSHEYSSQVLSPINADGSSVWPAKRGVIPMQFKVTDTPVTTTSVTTTTTKTTTVAYESLAGASDHTSWSVLMFKPTGPLTVSDITNLTAHFTCLQGHNQGGGFRWVLGTPNGQIWVHYGDVSSSLQTGTAGDGVNMLTTGEARVEASQLGHSPMYDTWANIKAEFGGLPVSYVQLTLDGGWATDGSQVINV